MVANEDTQASEIQNTTDNTGAFEKLKQTLSSSLLTAQDKGKLLPNVPSNDENQTRKNEIFSIVFSFHACAVSSANTMQSTNAVTKVSPRPSMTADAETVSMVQQVQQQQSQLHQQQHHSQSNQSNQVSSSNSSQQKPEPGKAPSRAGACRVCLKSFKPDDFSKICAECQQKVCEDCASYSKLDESEEAVSQN